MAEYYEAITERFIEQEDDISWIYFILGYLILFYEIHKNDKSFVNKNENKKTDAISHWLKNKKDFRRKVAVNS